MKAIDNAKFKLRQEMQALQRRLALLEEFEKQRYNTRICEEPYHDWEQIQWEDEWTGLRYEGYGNEVVKDLHICINCGIMRTTKFKLSDTVIEDPFDVLREEE
jgi:hypothetical protein|tara:strand:- start:827 stop:1135 length:309 start_codon:yes stop_codon:yes gene_type:complete